MVNYLFYIALLTIITEVGVTLYYWGELATLIGGHWWMSVLVALRTLTWRTIVLWLKKLFILGLIDIIKAIAIDTVFQKLFHFSLIHKIAQSIKTFTSQCYRKFSISWRKAHPFKKGTIIFAILPALLFTIGFIFYLPSTRRVGIKGIQKKSGSKVLRFMGRMALRFPFAILLADKVETMMAGLTQKFRKKMQANNTLPPVSSQKENTINYTKRNKEKGDKTS